jgi:DNA-binding response OmpR family regulator
MGVSRHHLALEVVDNHLLATDMGSGNGTLLNGDRLAPESGRVVSHGDTLTLGRLALQVRVVISPTFSSVIHKQASIQLNQPARQGEGELVLVVEDDVEVARAMALLLKRSGYTSQLSHDVIGAIRAFNQKRPAAVLLDLMLPDVNGLEFCRYVRRDVQRNTVPIIVVSAAKSADTVAQAISAGADVFLGKPVNTHELSYVLGVLVSHHTSGVGALSTKHLVGTAPLQAIAPESRQDAVVLFVAGHSDTPITLTVRGPVSFGRAPTPQSRHHVDLTRFDAADQGVSRLHMLLHNRDGGFYLEDADSVNGTFLNGYPVRPREPVQVSNADEIRLGQLRMYIYFITDKERSGGQPGLS